MPEDVRAKVAGIFSELAGDRAAALDPSRLQAGVMSTITAALTNNGRLPDEFVLRADTLSFHLCDWNADAAFLVALLLYPERFTPADIRTAIRSFMNHVPWHMSAAAEISDRVLLVADLADEAPKPPNE